MDLETAVIAGLIAGLVCGLLPLISGLVKGRRELGIIGFVACAVSGAVLGLLLAIPVAIVFTLAIFLWTPNARRRGSGATTG